jgi:hypothetical protein
MNRNIKYKQVSRLSLFGDDDVNTTTNSQYILYPSSIAGLTILSGGTNYNVSPHTQINITGGGGFGAAVTYTISAGAISSVTLTNSGFGYTSPPNITITSGVTNTTSLVGGTGYVDVNTQINVSGGGGGGGTVIIPTVASGVITALTITTFGSGYVTTPTITITSGITGTSNIVAGSGYTNGIYPLVVTGGDGSGCSGVFTISGGVLSSIVIGNAGTGYTSAPTLSFDGAGPGTGASATATLGTGASATAVIGKGASISLSGIFTNSKRLRFALNNSLNDLKLSQNARCVVETCNIPSITNLAGRYVLLRLVTSTQDKACDTKKFLNGNPILLSMATSSTANANNIINNASEFFYNINVPSNIFSNGYIDMELECPSATANIDFTTNKPLRNFFINLIIVDEDPELTKDLTLAPPVDYNNYNVNMPIRNY